MILGNTEQRVANVSDSDFLDLVTLIFFILWHETITLASFRGEGESKPPRFGTFIKSTKRKVVIIFCLRRGTFVPKQWAATNHASLSLVFLGILVHGCCYPNHRFGQHSKKYPKALGRDAQ